MAGKGRIDLFGPYVEASPEGPAPGDRRSDARPPGPRDVFDALVLLVDSGAGRRQCATLPCSVAVHAAAAVALIAVPLLVSSELPGPPGAVQAFFVRPMVVPPPPPPPPPAARAVAPRTVPAPRTVSEDRFTAPVEVPAELPVADGLDLGIEGGVPGGVVGGVPGGVVGVSRRGRRARLRRRRRCAWAATSRSR